MRPTKSNDELKRLTAMDMDLAKRLGKKRCEQIMASCAFGAVTPDKMWASMPTEAKSFVFSMANTRMAELIHTIWGEQSFVHVDHTDLGGNEERELT